MARPTRHDGIFKGELPAGMKVFTVTEQTIRDSLGAYCTEGQQAVLNKNDAQRYHKANQIQVGLPDFDAPKGPTAEEAQAALDALTASQKEAADAKAELAKLQAGATKVEAKKEEANADGEPGASEGGEVAADAGANRRSTRS